MGHAAINLLGLVLATIVAGSVAKGPSASLHTIFTTECGAYFTWQSMGLVYSHRKSGQPGALTRVMSCTPEEWDALTEEQRNIVPTHVAPSYTKHPRTGDVYSAYNKPVAVIDWLARNDVKEEYVLIIDADMIMRQPFIPEAVGAMPGRAVAAFFGYMKGVNNRLAMKHIPDVTPRNDTLAGPRGRRSDQVGGFTLMHTEDLKRVAPLWLKYTEDVRFDPDAWELTGDAYSTHKGDKPWISEMYGYSYACAKSDVWHICHHSAMLYPGYEVLEPPMVLHYGLLWDVKGTKPTYSFDKHWHYDFDPLKCPPWDLSPKARADSKGGLFPHPPRASSFTTKGNDLLRDLLSIEVPITLNQAFCERHRRDCPPSAELERECSLVDEYAEELQNALERMDLPDPCKDIDNRCAKWVANGECEANPSYMFSNCAKSCNICTPRQAKGAPVVTQRKAVVREKPLSRLARRRTSPPPEDAHLEFAGKYVQRSEEEPLIIKPKIGRPVREPVKRPGSTHEDEDDERGELKIPEIKLRCTRYASWSAAQVKACMELAEAGIRYDPNVNDPDGNASAADLHAAAHLLLDRTHDVGRIVGEGLQRVHLTSADGRKVVARARSMGPLGMIAWTGALVLLLLCVLRSTRRRRFSRGKSHKYSRKD